MQHFSRAHPCENCKARPRSWSGIVGSQGTQCRASLKEMDHTPTLDKMNLVERRWGFLRCTPPGPRCRLSDSGFIKPRARGSRESLRGEFNVRAGVSGAKSDLWTTLLENVIDAGDELTFSARMDFYSFVSVTYRFLETLIGVPMVSSWRIEKGVKYS